MINLINNKAAAFNKSPQHYLRNPSGESSTPLLSHFQLVSIIVLSVFICETLVMVIISFLPPFSSWSEPLFDSSLLIVLLSPVLYLYLFHPLVQYNTERKQVEKKLRRANQELENRVEKRTHDLGERVKELNCFYGISRLVEGHGDSLDEIFQGTIDLIPPSWQYPEITCARISLNGHEYKTENFKETRWKQASRIIVNGESIGTLEIFYLEKRPAIDEGPFLKEERSLIDALASRLGRIIERVRAEEKLKREAELNAALSELYEPLISPAASVEDVAYTVLAKAKSLTHSERGYVSSIDPITGVMVVLTHTEMLKDQYRVTGENRRPFFSPKKDGRYPNLWGHSLNTFKPFYTNSPATHEASKGVPEWHIPVHRFLSVPVMLGEDLVGQIALANKDKDYTEQDLETTNRVAEFYTLGIQRNRVEEALQKSHDELEKRVEERTQKLMLTNIKLKNEVEDRKLAEVQLMRADRLSSLGQLSGGIAHEIRNPLSGINLFVDILCDAEKFKRADQELEIFEEIKQSFKKINRIIKRVLDFAKHSDATSGEIEINSLIDEVLKLWHKKMRDTKIRQELSLQKDLSPIRGDTIEIQQVFNNLIQNAVEAMPAGGVLDIATRNGISSFHQDRPVVLIRIGDSGPGIPTEQCEKIFDPFFTTKSTGTGLGLSISHQIIERHGGIISFESRSKQATTFSIELPTVAGS